MKRIIGTTLLALIAGCADDGASDPGDEQTPARCAAETAEPLTQTSSCYATALLDGTVQPLIPVTFGPVTVGEVEICLTLDATRNRTAGRFIASSDLVDGDSPGFALRVEDQAGATLASSAPDQVAGQVRATVSYYVPAGSAVDVVLRLTAPVPCTTTVHVAMAEAPK